MAADTNTTTAIPSFFDDEGTFIRTLKGSDFPKTPEGRLARCDWFIKLWENRKQDIVDRSDPVKMRERRIKTLKQQIAALEKEAAELKEAKD